MVDGFSSMDPRQARGIQYAARPKRRRSSSRRTSSPSVSIRGGTVTINGKGFSVAPSLQAQFIRNQTKGRGSSAQSAISQAEKIEVQRKSLETQKQIDLNRLNNLKVDIQRSKMKQSEKTKILGRIEQQKAVVQFQSDIKSGKIQGVSGIGLSPSQFAKRDFLLRTGKFGEVSSKDNVFGNLDPLYSTFFVDTTPTMSEEKSFTNYIKSLQFSTKVKPKLGALESFIKRIDNTINDITKVPKSDSLKRGMLASKVIGDRNKLLGFLYKKQLVPSNFTKRQGSLLALSLTSSILKGGKLAFEGGKLLAGEVPMFVLSQKANLGATVKVAPKMPEAAVKITRAAYKKKGSLLPFSIIIAGAIKDDIVATGKLLMTEPGLGVAKIGTDYVVMRGAGKVLTPIGKLTTEAGRKLNPYYKKLNEGKILLKKTPEEIFKVRGVERYLQGRVKPFSIKTPFTSAADFLKGRRPGQFKKFQKTLGLELKEQTVKTGALPLSKQVGFAGRRITAVNTAANQLTTWIKRKSIVRKPIPGEENFPDKIKFILKNFDNGKITDRQFATVNIWLRKNVAPNITLLERSLYADPTSGLRVSRLGISKTGDEATLKDIIRGNFRLFGKGQKPQILVFEKVRVEKFPKSLNKIKDKLLKNQKLTENEINMLIKFQVKKSGMFKPIGSTIYEGGRELEVTLAPGEIIKVAKRVGFTVVDGKKVSIVMAEVFKPSTVVMKQISLAKLGKLSLTELKKLEALLFKKTKNKVFLDVPTFKIKGGKRVKVTRKAPRGRELDKRPILKFRARAITPALRRAVRRAAPRGKVRARTRVSKIPKPRAAPRAKPRAAPRAKVRASPRPTPRPSPRARPRAATRPKPKPKPTPRFKLTEFKKKKLKKPQPAYYVITRKGGKIVKLHASPLILTDAKNYLAYSLDHNLTRSAWLNPIGKTKNVRGLPKQMNGYFKRNSKKLRPYKIRHGKKKELLNGYIEKKKYVGDTRSEVQALRRARAKKKTVRKKKK